MNRQCLGERANCAMHTVSFYRFCVHFPFFLLRMARFSNACLCTLFFVKSQRSLLDFCHLTIFLPESWNLSAIESEQKICKLTVCNVQLNFFLVKLRRTHTHSSDHLLFKTSCLGPKKQNVGLQRIWSWTNLIPRVPVPLDKRSPENLFHWTNVPNQIQSGQMVPQNFIPFGQMIPNQFGPHIFGSPEPLPLDKRHILETIFPSRGTKLVGDRLSRGTNQLGTKCGGPNVRGPYEFGIKFVTAKFWPKITLWIHSLTVKKCQNLTSKVNFRVIRIFLFFCQ